MSKRKLPVLIAVAFLMPFLLSHRGFAGSNATLQSGINAFQQGKYDDAHSAFNELLNQKGWGFVALYNLGVTAARQKHIGEALGYFRRAHLKRPHDGDTLYNIQFLEDSLGPRGYVKMSDFDLFRAGFLNRFSFDEFLAVTLAASLFFFSFLLKYLKKRQAAKSEDAGIFIPPAPSLVIAGIVLLALMGVTVAKLADSYSERATVVADKTELRSGPSMTNASMTDIPEGAEVSVIDTTKDWMQVSLPGGGLTGWVQDQALMVTSGGGPW